MTAAAPDANLREFCERCEEETQHAVTIQLRVENAEADKPKCSREPYRVSKCLVCDSTVTRRMNDA